MPQVPNISVQLIHIQGPLKGQIQDFSQFPVKIGRHSSCQVRFDKDLTTISRRHARIERHGNRFRIIDASTNGTYVNGKRIADVYLRDGDVITFSDNGPKASFLTNIEAAEAPVQSIPSRAQRPTCRYRQHPLQFHRISRRWLPLVLLLHRPHRLPQRPAPSPLRQNPD
jgi:pSer/pThr/pTyr-binding forkhead associated (FHA) protein